MEKIIIALVVLFATVFAGVFFVMYLDVKKYCQREGYDFKLYWHDFIRGKVKAGGNAYFLEKYKIGKEDKS